MDRSLKIEVSSLYIQHAKAEYAIDAALWKSEIQGALAILRVTIKPSNSIQQRYQTLLHEESILAVYIDDEKVIDGFRSHLQETDVQHFSYQLELVSQDEILIYKVTPALSAQGDVRMLELNIHNT